MKVFNRLFFLVPFVCFFSIKSSGHINQELATSSITKKSPKIPVEQIYVHTNTTFFLPGESLLYKIYCINTKTATFSNLSKLSYVELIAEDLKVVFKHKILLKEGVGQGDYFIPASLPSGNYKLIAYTQLIKNKGVEYTFMQDISIVNPYQGNQTKISQKKENLQNDSIQQIVGKNSSNSIPELYTVNSKNTALSLTLSDSIVKKRAHVILKLQSLDKDLKNGRYSISIRKIDTFPTLPKRKAQHLVSKIKGVANEVIWDDDILIPELRGELIQGRVIAKNSTVQKLYNQKIAISVPGKSYEMKLVKTYKNGLFWFSKENQTSTQEHVFLQVLGPHKEQYQIEMDVDSNFRSPSDSISFGAFHLHPKMEKMLIDRSVRNQIRNGFFAAKRDTILVNNSKKSPLDGMFDEEYILDDYNRFSSVSETVVEVISNLWIGKDKLGNKSFKIRINDEAILQQRQNSEIIVKGKLAVPLVIVDGLILQDHEKLLSYPASKIKKMSLIRKKFVLGLETFVGVLEVTTFEGLFFNTISDSSVFKKALTKPLEEKKYFKQQYSDSLKYITDRIPDFRDQLLWEPNQTLKNETTIVPFFTSDNEGVYEINIEGFTKTGKPVSVKKNFKVR